MKFSTRLLLLLRFREHQSHISITEFCSTLPSNVRRRRDPWITKRSLQSPSMSAFNYLFSSGNYQSLITLTGFDFAAFHNIRAPLSQLYERYSPYYATGSIRILPVNLERWGRPRSMKDVQCLSLVLTFSRKRGSEMVLCMLFDITASVSSLCFRCGRRIMLHFRSGNGNALIKIPTNE